MPASTVPNYTLKPWIAAALRTAGVLALLAMASACTTRDRYDVPRPTGSTPSAAPGAGPAAMPPQGSAPAPYYQGASPDYPRGTTGRGGRSP